jgi:GIY-YIG catalytic domain/AP2 domain
MGFIYIIKNKLSDKVYIGQTTKPSVEERWKEHKQCALRMLTFGKDAECNYSIRNSYIYRAMAAHGIENFTCDELRADVDHEVRGEDGQTELDRVEMETIQRYNSIAPHGYNLNTGGSSFKHNEESIKLMVAVKAANIDNNRHEKLKGFPLCCTYRLRNNIDEIIIRAHPLCGHKTFSVKIYGTLEKAREACCDFVKKLEESGDAHKRTKKGEDDLPSGVILTSKGYRVHKQINKKNYNRYFNAGTPEEKKKNALDYLASIMPVAGIPAVEEIITPALLSPVENIKITDDIPTNTQPIETLKDVKNTNPTN